MSKKYMRNITLNDSILFRKRLPIKGSKKQSKKHDIPIVAISSKPVNQLRPIQQALKTKLKTLPQARKRQLRQRKMPQRNLNPTIQQAYEAYLMNSFAKQLNLLGQNSMYARPKQYPVMRHPTVISNASLPVALAVKEAPNHQNTKVSILNGKSKKKNKSNYKVKQGKVKDKGTKSNTAHLEKEVENQLEKIVERAVDQEIRNRYYDNNRFILTFL